MQRDIDDGKFVEWGEYEGHLYGTKIDSIRNVMRTGKMCILDLSPTVLVFICRYLSRYFATSIAHVFEFEDICMQPNMCGFEDFFALKTSILLYHWMAVGLRFEMKYSHLIY